MDSVTAWLVVSLHGHCRRTPSFPAIAVRTGGSFKARAKLPEVPPVAIFSGRRKRPAGLLLTCLDVVLHLMRAVAPKMEVQTGGGGGSVAEY